MTHRFEHLHPVPDEPDVDEVLTRIEALAAEVVAQALVLRRMVDEMKGER